MPLFIFIPSEPAIGGSLYGVPLAPYDTEGHIPINSNIVFAIGALGTVVLDYSTLDININGVPVVSNGIPAAGYSLSHEIGHFYNVTGIIFTLNPPSNLASFTTFTIDATYNTINLLPFSLTYTFRTSDKIRFLSNFHFGIDHLDRYYFDHDTHSNSQNRGDFSLSDNDSFSILDLLSNPLSSTKYIIPVDSVGGIPESLNQYLGNFTDIASIYSGDDVSISPDITDSLTHPATRFIGDDTGFDGIQGTLSSVDDARIAQTQNQPTLFPTLVGPRFGALVLDKQVSALKIQK